MKKLITAILAVAMLFSISTMAFATDDSGYENEPQYASFLALMDDVSISPQDRTSLAPSDSIEITGTITDAAKIQALVNDGLVECDAEGNNPTKIVVHQIVDNSVLDESVMSQIASDFVSPNSLYSIISVTRSDFYDGQYFDDYDRYVVDGPCDFTEEYERKDTANWNCTLSANASVGEKDVKAAVSSSMGYSIGTSYTRTSKYAIKIPANKKWEIKIWTSFRVFTYTAKVGSLQVATGKCWYPNGLIILHTEYNR